MLINAIYELIASNDTKKHKLFALLITKDVLQVCYFRYTIYEPCSGREKTMRKCEKPRNEAHNKKKFYEMKINKNREKLMKINIKAIYI